MSQISNSYEYYQSSQGLLRMLNNKKGGNALINQLVADNDMKYQNRMEELGFKAGKGNDKYKNVDTASTNLLDALEKLQDKDLFSAEEGKEYDKSNLLKAVSNYVCAYNSTVSNLTKCGGALYNSFDKELKASFKEKAEEFAKLGISLEQDGKLAVNQDKLNEASVDDIKALFEKSSGYVSNMKESLNSINEIIGKAIAMSSTNYNPQGLMY